LQENPFVPAKKRKETIMAVIRTVSTTSVKIKDRQYLREKWGWFFFLGTLLTILGVAAMATPFVASIAVALFVGILLLVSGVMQMIHAFSFRKVGDFIGEMALSIIGILVGLYMVFNPLLGVSALTLVLGIYLIVEGISKTYIAFRWRPIEGWQWSLFSGIVAIILGILIFLRWPLTAFWLIGVLLGINFIFMGTSFVMLGLTLRRLGSVG
jgi:uncharacterized membrane protein HdeD (DUF308 family)